MATLDEARSAKDVALALFSKRRSVNGIGIAREPSGYIVRINAEHGVRGVPPEIDGVPVVVHIVGRIFAQAQSRDVGSEPSAKGKRGHLAPLTLAPESGR
jgi:hypothetical protein